MIFGLEPVKSLPPNYTPLEAVAIVKCLDEDGDLALSIRTTGGLTIWELVGMLTAAADTARRDCEELFEVDEPDEEAPDGG